MTAPTAAGIVPQWYRDSCSCLQTTLASMSIMKAVDPLELLARTVNLMPEKGVRHAEYYSPMHPRDGMLGWVCPDTGVSGRWVDCPDVLHLRELVSARPAVIVPVDNYYLPFRPAYNDVHAAHLVLVTDYQERDGVPQLYVSDAQPPAFQGWLPEKDLIRAWSSENPQDVQDAFFSGSTQAGKVLLVDVPDLAEPTPTDVLAFAATGARRLVDTTAPGSVSHARDMWHDLTDSDCTDLYIVGWWHQAQAHLHSERWASLPDAAWSAPIVESAQRIATAWTPVRIAAARHARVTKSLRGQLSELLHSYERYAYSVLVAQEQS